MGVSASSNCSILERSLTNFCQQDQKFQWVDISISLVFHYLSYRKVDYKAVNRIAVLMLTIGYSCQILMKLEFSQQIFEKSSNI